MNNSKLILFLSCFAVLTLTSPLVTAAPRGGGGGQFGGGQHFGSMPARGGMDRFNNRRFVFVGSFGFPWWWGWGWDWGYPYGYYGYGSPYGYGYGYPYGYDSGYQGSNYGGTSYGSDYPTHSRVAELQRRLAQAGYYHGAIDGILGPRTQQAIRAYERDHGYAG